LDANQFVLFGEQRNDCERFLGQFFEAVIQNSLRYAAKRQRRQKVAENNSSFDTKPSNETKSSKYKMQRNVYKKSGQTAEGFAA